MSVSVTDHGKITVRIVTSKNTGQRYYGVGQINDGKWSLLRDTVIPLIYTMREKAKAYKCAAHIREQQRFGDHEL